MSRIGMRRPHRAAPGEHRFERQAEECGRRAARPPARQEALRPPPPRLAPRPAAAIDLPGSIGRPLPKSLRDRLEMVFAADLSAVRLHTDAAAAAAAADYGARAFAAGADIVFGAAAPSLASPAGIELLAHETAHVLQQTARRAGDGRLVAQPLPGRDDVLPQFDLWADLRAAHAAQETDENGPVHRLLADIDRAIGGSLEGEAAARELTRIDGEVTAGRHDDTPIAQQQVLYDVLKVTGRYDAAFHLLDQRPAIRTFRLTEEALAAIAARPMAEWQRLVIDRERSTVANRAIFALRAWVQRSLLSLTSSLDEPQGITDAVADVEGTAGEALRLYPNERDAMAIYAAQRVRTAVAGTIRDARRWGTAGARGAGSPSPQLGAVARLRHVASVVLDQADRARRVPPVNGDERDQLLAGKIAAIARPIVDFWIAAQTRLAEEIARVRRLPETEIWTTAPRITLPDIPSVREARATLRRAIPPMFTIAPGPAAGASTRLERAMRRAALATRLPSAEDYDAQADRTAGEIRAALDAVAADVVARFEGQTRSEADALAVLAFYLEALGELLRRRHTGQALDSLLFDRAVLARSVHDGGLMFQWADVANLGDAVLAAEDIGFSYLVLPNDWVLDAGVPLQRLSEDISRIVLSDPLGEAVMTPLTGADLVILFHVDYLDRVRTAVATHLAAHEATPATGAPSLASVVNPIAEFPRPRRWRAADAIFILGEDGTLPGELVLDHPRTFAMKAGAWAGTDQFAPINRTSEAVIWVMPGFAATRDRLRQIPEVAALVATWDSEPDDAATWLHQVAIAGRTETAEPTVMRETAAALAPLLARASTLERRVAAIDIRGILARFRGNRLRLDVLDAALARIEVTWRNAQPLTQQDLQLAALMLDLGADLADTFASRVPPAVQRDYLTLYVETALTALDRAGEEALDGILGPGETRAALLAGREPLLRVRTAFDEARRRVQEQFGLESDGSQLTSLMSAFPVLPGEAHGFVNSTWSRPPLPIDRPAGAAPLPADISVPHYYEIVTIHRAFRYHPALTGGGGAGARPDILRTPEGRPIDPGTDLVTFRWATVTGTGDARSFGPDVEVVVRAGDGAALTVLTHIIDAQARLIGLESLAENIQAFQEGLLDVVELVPGYGQAVAAARLSVGVAQFLGEHLPHLREELIVRARAEIEQLTTALADGSLFSSARIWDFLLGVLDNSPLHRFERDPRHEARRVRMARPGPSGRRLTRLIAMARGLLARVANAIRRIRERMAPPLLAARSDIATRPRIAAFLRDAPELLTYGRSVIEGVTVMLEQRGVLDAESRRAEIARLFAGIDAIEAVAEDPSAITQALQQLVDGLATVELPDEVVPMNVAVEVILAFALDRVAGAKGRIARRVLDATGLLPPIARQIAEGLQAGGVDINDWWRNTMRPPLVTKFEEARDAMLAGFVELVNIATGGRVALTRPDTTAIAVEAEPFPEIELWPSGPPAASRYLPSGGAALPPALRAAAERSFGHDFGHVRLHTGPAAAASARSFGARALATGSHVVLGAGISAATPGGRDIIAHELAHVLQQTGPRPLGRAYPQRPSRGRPGQGVRRDPSREAAADRMARSRGGNGAVRVESAGGSGLMANGADASVEAATGVAAALASGAFIRGLAAEIEAGRTTAGEPPGMADANVIWRGVRTALQGNDPATWPGFLPNGPTRTAARNLVLERRTPSIPQVLAAIARRAQEPLPRARGGGGRGGTAGAAATRLNPRRFADALGGYILSATGLSIGISIDTRPQLRVDRVRVRNLHLGRVEMINPIWQAVKRADAATFSERRWGIIRAQYEQRFPEPHRWHASETRLHADEIRDWQQQFMRPAGVTFPTWADFRDPNRPANDQPGMRVATHGELTRGISSRMSGEHRHSHHLPQFLLVEFFRNDNATKLTGRDGQFRLPGFAPAATEANATSVTFNSFSSGGTTIDLQALDPNRSDRGAGMPAVALAAETHQLGTLHMSAEPHWDNTWETRPTAVQGGTIYNRFFRDNLFRELRPLAPPDARDVTQPANFRRVVDDPTKQDAVKAATLRSMRAVFRWMVNDRMIPALQEAIPQREALYYERQVIDQSGVTVGNDGRPAPPYKAENPESAAAAVITALRTKHDALMAQWKE